MPYKQQNTFNPNNTCRCSNYYELPVVYDQGTDAGVNDYNSKVPNYYNNGTVPTTQFNGKKIYDFNNRRYERTGYAHRLI